MTDTNRKLIRNRCKCTHCGDIIESKHRHDFVQCKCERIFTDGGTAYVRRGFHERGDIEDMSEYEEVVDGTTQTS